MCMISRYRPTILRQLGNTILAGPICSRDVLCTFHISDNLSPLYMALRQQLCKPLDIQIQPSHPHLFKDSFSNSSIWSFLSQNGAATGFQYQGAAPVCVYESRSCRHISHQTTVPYLSSIDCLHTIPHAIHQKQRCHQLNQPPRMVSP